MSRMRMMTPSPGSAPTISTGWVTSWPPRSRGVIIGPQQPGAVLAMIVPPFSTGPSIGWLGSSTLLVKPCTTTLRCAVFVGLVMSSISSSLDRQIARHVAAAPR